jgi:quercetin dioxygenase-like cupin family protein
MSASMQRERLEPTPELFRRSGDIPSTRISPERAEGEGMTCRLLMVTDDMQCSEVTWKKGARGRPLANPDHSTIACLTSGKLKLTIGDETFVASSGDAWMYPQGIVHRAEALEDSTALEVKAPACPS